jgi:hypothetical protein
MVGLELGVIRPYQPDRNRAKSSLILFIFSWEDQTVPVG